MSPENRNTPASGSSLPRFLKDQINVSHTRGCKINWIPEVELRRKPAASFCVALYAVATKAGLSKFMIRVATGPRVGVCWQRRALGKQ